jgi:uncharacterized membrane protein
MSRLLPLVPLLLAPLPALAADGASGTAIVGGAALVVVLLAGLLAVPGARKGGVAAAALFGILVAGYLTAQHNSPDASVCNINSTFNCDLVNRSEYSVLFGKVPVALLGVAFYAAMAWLALRHVSAGAGATAAAMTGLAGLAVAFDVYLAWASSQLGAWCPLCMVSWALNVVLFAGAFVLWRGTGTPNVRGLVDAIGSQGGGIVVVGLLTLIAGNLAGPPSPGPGADGAAVSTDALASYYEQPAGRIELDGTEPATGPADARFTIVEWADYECPHCALMAGELKKVLAANKDVRILFKHYPISGSCNQFVEGERHKFACNAAAAPTAAFTASGSMSTPQACMPSFAPASARMPDPQPTSRRVAPGRASVSTARRQARVVACSPVPNALPGSITSAPVIPCQGAATTSRAEMWTGSKCRFQSCSQSSSACTVQVGSSAGQPASAAAIASSGGGASNQARRSTRFGGRGAGPLSQGCR